MLYDDPNGLLDLVVDKFGGYLAIQISNWGVEYLQQQVVDKGDSSI
ncbi:hypothetical protein [uncultured Microbulbifer sp.]|nr:hypothetical protein [uncultured Microbulbifer sp.]